MWLMAGLALVHRAAQGRNGHTHAASDAAAAASVPFQMLYPAAANTALTFRFLRPQILPYTGAAARYAVRLDTPPLVER